MFGLKEKLKAECIKEILSEPMFYGILKYEDLYKEYIKLDNEELVFIYKLLQYASSTLPEQEEEVREQFYNIDRKIRRIFSRRKSTVKLPKLKIVNKCDRLDGDFACLAMILHCINFGNVDWEDILAEND